MDICLLCRSVGLGCNRSASCPIHRHPSEAQEAQLKVVSPNRKQQAGSQGRSQEMINSTKQWCGFLRHVSTCRRALQLLSAEPLSMSSRSSSLLNNPYPPPSSDSVLTLKSFSWNSVMSARCYVSHYTSVILHHRARFRCECSALPSVSSLHISFSISPPELLNKLEVTPAPFAL